VSLPGGPKGEYRSAPHEGTPASPSGGLRATLARGGYAWLLRLLTPVYLFRLWLRGRAEPLYRHTVAERLGAYKDLPAAGSVWVHAVSLGETRAAAALIDALRAERPGMRLLLTHSTATGREAGQSLLRDGDRQTWLPYDTPGAVRRFLRHFNPSIGVLMETEIWPNLLRAAQAARVPMVLANARLSARSYRQGARFASLLRPAAESLALVLAQTEDDARRISASGAGTVEVCGNLKFDLTPDPDQLVRGAAWRALLNRDVVLAAVTREGEEAQLLAVWAGRPASDALLLIVPRHPQRFDEVAELVRQAGFTLARRSSWDATPPTAALQAQVWLGDTMREMAQYYATSNVALLGGSFAPLGGQNLIEAAACGCPLVMGPSTFNFSEAAELSLAAGAALRVADMTRGVTEVDALLVDPPRLAAVSAAALRFAAQHRGAAVRMAQRIAPLIQDR
jgi:3-deoxy-D-manno-octulosonic-acid transferase